MKIVHVSCGSYHSFVQNSKGEVYTFGLNLKGQLGIGSFDDKKKPILVHSLLPGGIKNPKSNFFIDTMS
jgi:alpha-tubulin suppressor-like RCC1 family protein